MECILHIILNKNIDNDFCLLLPDSYEENKINIVVHTKGIDPIDFKKLNYISLGDNFMCQDFVEYFSYGRKVLKNVKEIYIEHNDFDNKNTLEQNKELVEVIKRNNMLNDKIYLDVGDMLLTKEDIELLAPFKECACALVTYDDTGVYHSVRMLELLFDIINAVIKRTEKYDFSPLEKMLYSYDIIRTNFMIDPEYKEKMEKLLELYPEPSFCYAQIYKEVLKKFDIKSHFSSGNFYKTECRAINIARVEDEKYEIDGVFYFDIGKDSKQRFSNSLMNLDDNKIREELINNYGGFCKTKDFMVYKNNLDMDYAFGVFDKDFMEIYDSYIEQFGINGVYQLQGILNNVGYFIDGRTVIDAYQGIKDEKELDEIRTKAEEYSSLFGNDLEGEDFLELLFNVRKVEYMEDKNLFQLSTQILRESVFKSKFNFSRMNIDLSEDQEYEQEDISEVIEESFDMCFEETVTNTNIEERIRKLKLSLNNKNKSDNNDNK